MKKIIYSILFLLLLLVGVTGCKDLNINPNLPNNPPINEEEEDKDKNEEIDIDEDGLYISKDDVALYIATFNKLPSNYLTKSQVDGHISNIWTSENLASVGGDIFYNREKLLPIKTGRTFIEADINYQGSQSRGAERIVYSNDGLIFYTSDHYESFVLYNKETKELTSY